jgi:Histone acetyl transferase HAT1 N-terminus.
MPAVFFREAIFGYQDLKIQLYYSAARLTTYFGISYSDKVTADKFEGIEVNSALCFCSLLYSSSLCYFYMYSCITLLTRYIVLPCKKLDFLNPGKTP